MEPSGRTNMNDLPKDVMVFLSMELNLPDLINLCIANGVWNANVCKNDTFWMRRFQRDFPHVPKSPNMTYKQQMEYIYRNDKFPGFKTPKGLPSLYDKSFEAQLVKEGILPIDDTKTHHLTGFSLPIHVKPEIIEFIKGVDFGKVPAKYGSGTLKDLLDPLLKEKILSLQVATMLITLYLQRNQNRLKTGSLYKADEYMKTTLGSLLNVIDKEGFKYHEAARIGNDVRDKEAPFVNATPRILNMLKNLSTVILEMKKKD